METMNEDWHAGDRALYIDFTTTIMSLTTILLLNLFIDMNKYYAQL